MLSWRLKNTSKFSTLTHAAKKIYPQGWDNAIIPNTTSSIVGASAEQREDLKKARFKRPIDQLDNDSEYDNDGTNVVAS